MRGILRQEPAWFDSFDILELPSRVSKECTAIHAATGEKFALIFQGLAMSAAGFAVAFLIGWKFALICLALFPVLTLGIVVMGVLMKTGFAQQMKAFNKAGAYAEQAFNLIKIVVAFGQEHAEEANFNRFLEQNRKDGIKNHARAVFGWAFFGIIIYGGYAYGLSMGALIIHNKWMNGDTPFVAGDIISIFFGIIFGAFALGMGGPFMKAVAEGRANAYSALSVINRRPEILINDLSAP